MSGILKSIRFAFRWRSKKQGAVDAVAQVDGARNATAQVSNSERPIQCSAFVAGVNDTGDKHQADNSVVVAECWDGFEKNNWCGRGSVNQGWVDRVGHSQYSQGLNQPSDQVWNQSVKVPT